MKPCSGWVAEEKRCKHGHYQIPTTFKDLNMVCGGANGPYGRLNPDGSISSMARKALFIPPCVKDDE